MRFGVAQPKGRFVIVARLVGVSQVPYAVALVGFGGNPLAVSILVASLYSSAFLIAWSAARPRRTWM